MTLPQPTKDALEAWLTARGTEAGPLFVNFDRAKKGGRLTGAAVRLSRHRLREISGQLPARHGRIRNIYTRPPPLPYRALHRTVRR